MELTLEIGDREVYRMKPDNDFETARIIDSWKRILRVMGVYDYQILKTFKSKLNADNRWKTDTDDYLSEESAEGLQRMDNVYL